MNIILLLILVVIIFKLLFSNFGFLSEDELKQKEEAIKKYLEDKIKTENNNCACNSNNIFAQQNKAQIEEPKQITILTKSNKQEEEFSEEMFLKTVEKVVDMVIIGLAENKTDVLKTLLTIPMYVIFEKEVEQNIKEHKVLKSVIVSFEDKKILSRTQNVVEVQLSMKQINYIENEKGEITSGNKNETLIIKEVWEFVKNKEQGNEVPWLINSIREF